MDHRQSEIDRHSGRERSGASLVLLYGTVLTFLTPLLVFLLVALLKGMDVIAALNALIEQCSQRRQNPLLSSVPALIPLVIFAAWLGFRARRTQKSLREQAMFGIGIAVAAQIAVNWGFWQVFLPSRVYPGFPHGLEFIIGPLFFTPIAMVLGLVGLSIALRKR